MATVRFTESIQRHVDCPTREVAGRTLRDVLEDYFGGNERSRGDRLAFGSTTGSLWFSDNAGDSWTTASSNLPPIYAVRFEKPVG